MMYNLCQIAALTLVLFAAPFTTAAQNASMDDETASEPPGFMMFNQNIIEAEDVAQYGRDVDSLLKPILDDLADEGLISSWGILTHAWGDEWNWNWYIMTSDHAAFRTAWSEMVERFEERHPDGWGLLLDPVQKHKDNLYTVRHREARSPAEGQAPAGVVMLNQHIVAMGDIPAMDALFDSTTAAVLSDMLDEGLIHTWGQLTHSWGDEWNYNFYFSSDDQADFANDWAEFTKRMSDQYPDSWAEWTKLSTEHRDNLYSIRYTK